MTATGNFDAWKQRCLKVKRDLPREEMSKLVRRTALRALSLVVYGSPVGNPSLWQSPPPDGYVGGHFRANWHVSVGSIKARVIDDIDASGASTVQRGVGELAAVKTQPYTVTWLHNSLPYAMALEYGHSRQAPQGVVGVAMVRLRSESPSLFGNAE